MTRHEVLCPQCLDEGKPDHHEMVIQISAEEVFEYTEDLKTMKLVTLALSDVTVQGVFFTLCVCPRCGHRTIFREILDPYTLQKETKKPEKKPPTKTLMDFAS